MSASGSQKGHIFEYHVLRVPGSLFKRFLSLFPRFSLSILMRFSLKVTLSPASQHDFHDHRGKLVFAMALRLERERCYALQAMLSLESQHDVTFLCFCDGAETRARTLTYKTPGIQTSCRRRFSPTKNEPLSFGMSLISYKCCNKP